MRTGHSGCALQNGACNRGVVINRTRVGHRTHGRKASARGRARAGFDRLGAFPAGLAQMAMQVNETGRNDKTGGIERFTIGGRGGLGTLCRRDACNASPIDPYVALRVGSARGIDDPSILNEQHGPIPWHHRSPTQSQS